MEELQAILLTSWGVVTVALIVLLIYRSILSSREDDQIFIDTAEQHHFQVAGAELPTAHFRQQQEIFAKISRLTKPILALAVGSGVLLLTSGGIWLYGVLKTF